MRIAIFGLSDMTVFFFFLIHHSPMQAGWYVPTGRQGGVVTYYWQPTWPQPHVLFFSLGFSTRGFVLATANELGLAGTFLPGHGGGIFCLRRRPNIHGSR
jgi:hypothetical protein